MQPQLKDNAKKQTANHLSHRPRHRRKIDSCRLGFPVGPHSSSMLLRLDDPEVSPRAEKKTETGINPSSRSQVRGVSNGDEEVASSSVAEQGVATVR